MAVCGHFGEKFECAICSLDYVSFRILSYHRRWGLYSSNLNIDVSWWRGLLQQLMLSMYAELLITNSARACVFVCVYLLQLVVGVFPDDVQSQ